MNELEFCPHGAGYVVRYRTEVGGYRRLADVDLKHWLSKSSKHHVWFDTWYFMQYTTTQEEALEFARFVYSLGSDDARRAFFAVYRRAPPPVQEEFYTRLYGMTPQERALYIESVRALES